MVVCLIYAIDDNYLIQKNALGSMGILTTLFVTYSIILIK